MSPLLISVYLSMVSVLIPMGLALLQWKKISKDIAPLRWLLVAVLILDIILRIMSHFSIHNLWVGDIFMFIQFTILFYIFSLQFAGKTIFKVVYLLVIVAYGIELLFLDDAIKLIRSNAIDGLVLIIVSIAFFYKLLNELKVINIHRLPILWVAFATLFYYSGNFFVFQARDYLETDKEALTLLWILHNALNIIKNILFAIALWQSYRTLRTANG